MQPLLRRMALRLQDAHDVEGPVFWRPYASQACMDPSHARNAIVYTHLNPVRAGLCDDPADYPWSSHTLYADRGPGAPPPELAPLRALLDPSLALPLFATTAAGSQTQLRADYRLFARWRLETVGSQDGESNGAGSSASWSGSGLRREDRWSTSLSPLFHSPVRPGPHGRAVMTPDLATLARATLAAETRTVTLDEIRGRSGGRERSRLRHCVIRRLHAAGYRNVDIAHFLDLSESAVSYVVCRRSPDS